MARKKVADEGVKGDWIVTYSDMVTLLLCFFVALFDPSEADATAMAMMISAMNNIGMGASTGGTTYAAGRSADLGNTIMSLPSMEQGRALGTALRKAVSLFNPEIRSNKVRVTHDERGLVISLASDAFFNPASARINIDATRDILLRLGTLLVSEELRDRKFRIEGHTDSEDTDPDGPWEDNWQLSSERSRAVLRYLSALGVQENRFQIAGFADTVPLARNDTAEGRAYNRRVDIIILDEGHL
jgi:chemotaxis protein MotB